MERIGKYEIVDKIGEGGFGVVFRGRDPFIKRAVAVKTCSSGNGDVRKRFFREAEIAGNLHHPNIVTVHDFGLDGDTPFLVQELLSGQDLDQHLGQGLPLATKLRYLRDIGRALQYAHSQGVIHRDIKPSNIRVLDDGRIKVMDFGIARAKDQSTQLTQTGTTVGTVAYLAPEQLKGDEIDNRADVFSFGVLAYELVSGRRPFDSERLPELFYAVVHGTPTPLAQLVRDCPPRLLRLIDRCLEKDPKHRYPGFTELLAELDLIMPLDPPPNRSPEETTDLPTDAIRAAALRRRLSDATGAHHGRGDPGERHHDRDDGEGSPQASRLQALLVDARIRIDGLLEQGRVEEAGIHVSRLRGALGSEPEYRLLERRFKAARRAKLQGEDPVAAARAVAAAPPPRPAPPRTDNTEPDVVLPTHHAVPLGSEEPAVPQPATTELAADGAEGRPAPPGQREPAETAVPDDNGSTPPPLAATELHAAAAKAMHEAEAFLARGQLEQCGATLEKARGELGSLPELDALEDRLRSVVRLKTLTSLVDQAQREFVAGRSSEAQRLALEALKIDPGHLEARAVFKKAEARPDLPNHPLRH